MWDVLQSLRDSIRNRLHERLANVAVVQHIDLGGHVVGEVEELLAGRHRHQDNARALFDGTFHDVESVV